MGQSSDTEVPAASIADNNKNSGNGLKIITSVACAVAICGIGFGIYGMMQKSSQDNTKISDLKIQIENSDGTITTIEAPEIKTTTEGGTTVTISDPVAEIVQTAMDEERSYPWPEDLERMDYEPEIITNKVVIPEITIDSSVAQSINSKIAEEYTKYLEDGQNICKGPCSVSVNYDSIVYDDILYLIIRTNVGAYRAGGSSKYDVYYYDINNDKELSVQDIISKYRIPQTSATVVIPSVLGSFDVYYRDTNYCYRQGCEVIDNV